MHPDHAVLGTFCSFFAKRDRAGMAACHHLEVEFSDPVFARLKRQEARAEFGAGKARA